MWSLAALLVGLPFVFLLMLTFMTFEGPTDKLPHYQLMMLGWIVFGAVFIYAFPLIPVVTVRRGAVSPNGPITVTLTDSGVRFDTAQSTGDAKWTVFTRATETSEFFFFYFSKHAAHILPKRVVEAPKLDSVRRLLKAQFAERARLLG